MSDLMRISLSIEKSLFERLETMVEEDGYQNRSEFIRDMIRDRLVEEEWSRDEEALGTVTLIYDHHARELGKKLTDLQHKQHDNVMATTHVHLDHHLCAEMIMLRGKAGDLKALADSMRQQKGVLHAKLTLSSTGKKLR